MRSMSRGIVEAHRAGRHGELAGPLEVAARVDLEHVDLAGVGEPEIHAAVVADPQRPVRVHRDLLQPRPQLVGEVGQHRLGALVLLAPLVPLGLAVHAPWARPRETR